MEEEWALRLPEVVIRTGLRKPPRNCNRKEALLRQVVLPQQRTACTFHPLTHPVSRPWKQKKPWPVPRARSQPRSRKLLFHLQQPPLQRVFTPPQAFLRKLGTELSPVQMAVRLELPEVVGPKVLAGGFQCPTQDHLLGLWGRSHWSQSLV